MIAPGFLIALGVVIVGAVVAALFLLRKARQEPEDREPGPDPASWSRLVRMGTLALTAYGQKPTRPAHLHDVAPDDLPSESKRSAHAPLRKVDLDPGSLMGQPASQALAELGPPDRVAPGEAWFSKEEATHYLMDSRGNLAKVPVFGAVPVKIPVGEPYLRWSWDHLVRPSAPAEAVTWTLCLTAPEGVSEPVVAEILTHPTTATY